MTTIHAYAPLWGSWHIESLIGEGSFGKVYKVRKEEFGKTYYSAVKIISIPQNEADLRHMRNEGLDDASVRSYFQAFVSDILQEIDLMSQLRGNSNIVSFEDHKVIERTDGFGWDILIRMELLQSLSEKCLEQPMDEAEIVKLGIHICRALELCARTKTIHRDIKPDNIFVSAYGDYKLGDFGIARQIERTMTGLSKKGTYTYMAPEVFKGDEYGASVDFYSLSIVMYRLLNKNRTPFLPAFPAPIMPADRDMSLQRRIKGEDLPAIPCVSDELNAIILKACAFDRHARYASATEMREALEAYTTGKSAVPVATPVILPEPEQPEKTDVTVGAFDTLLQEQTEATSGAFEALPQGAKTSGVVEKSQTGAPQQEVFDGERSGKRKNRVILVIVAGLLVVVLAIAVNSLSSKPYNSHGATTSTGAAVTPALTEPETERPLKEVHVSNAKEFLAAIGPNTRIIMKAGVYNYSNLWGEPTGSKYVEWFDYYRNGEDGTYCPLIKDVDNLTIEAANGKVEIVTNSDSLPVLWFEKSNNIVLDGITMGHDLPWGGTCTYGVIDMRNCKNFTIKNSLLYGCGEYGFGAEDVIGLTLFNTIIEECTGSISWLSSCRDVFFESCVFRLNRGSFTIYNSDVLFENCEFKNNTAMEYADYLIGNESEYANSDDVTISFDECIFSENSGYARLTSQVQCDFFSCTFVNNGFKAPKQQIELAIPSNAVAFDGHHYLAISAPIGWSEAKKQCEEWGGHLVTITSAAEQQFVASLLARDFNLEGIGSYACYWIGAKKNSAGKWEWVTGEPFSYTNWLPNEPSGGEGENYILLTDAYYQQLGWNDATSAGHDKYYYICEWDY